MATVDMASPSVGLEDSAPLIAENAPCSPSIDTTKVEDLYSQTITFAVDENNSKLSAPKTNNSEQQFIPRNIISSTIPDDIISSSISTTRLQSELLRPLLAGTYQELPAYLLKLQFQFQIQKDDRSWLYRIRTASISVVLEDAPHGEKTKTGRRRRAARPDKDVKHPAIAKTFPDSNGWRGPIATRSISNEVDVGLQASWGGLSADINWSQNRTRDVNGSAKVDMSFPSLQGNSLQVNLTENPVDASGIPHHLVIPLIVTHHSRRFSMRVDVKATFGFWRGKLAKSVPVLGRADEPLFFDPATLEQKMEAGERGIGGTKVIEWAEGLEEMDLQAHSSLE